MKILVIGSGGREHALAWKIAQSPKAEKIYVAPGNGGTEDNQKISNLPVSDFNELINFCKTENIDFTVVGPEVPLANGVVDVFKKKGLKIFGPCQSAAQLESSKEFAKDFMTKYKIPTAFYKTFTKLDDAHLYIKEKGAPIVIKADGLAAGKGVIVALTEHEAHQAVDSMLESNEFGEAGARVVIEEFLEGEEASFIVMSDGNTIFPMASSQDHKRLLNKDEGPNTGGMGAYSPAPIIDESLHNKIMEQVIYQTINGLKNENITFEGFLYAGVMIKNNEIKVLEFNCRMGDPETQPILFRLENDLCELLNDACEKKLHKHSPKWTNESAITVVIAAKNYPNTPEINKEIFGLSNHDLNSYVFHAGTKKENGKVITSGGRVLGVTAKGSSLKEAFDRVYGLCEKIKFDGAQYRTDIGSKALK
jgi:phosphoribosylamine--glycine ligase